MLKKVMVTSAVAVAALAIIVPVASAQVVVKDAGGETCPSISGEVGGGSPGTGGCEFVAVSHEMTLSTHSSGLLGCSWVLAGVMDGEGNGLVNDFLSSGGPNPFCRFLTPEKLPWSVTFNEGEEGVENTIDVGWLNLSEIPLCLGQVTGQVTLPQTTQFEDAQISPTNCWITGNLTYSGLSVE